MSNCDKLLKAYDLKKISLTEAKRNILLTKRNTVENKLKNSEKLQSNDYKIEFRSQGSFLMDTIINPIDEEDSYDIDHGIYFVSKNEPILTSNSLKNKIYTILEDHTNDVINKKKCVRVTYSVSDDMPAYHIDVPVYWQYKNETPKLATTDDWLISDPVQFAEWYLNLSNNSKDQLKRITRYIKWWSKNLSNNMPKGIILTILTANNFHIDEKDDVSLYETVNSMYYSLSKEFSCFRPTVPTDEDLFNQYAKTSKEYFLDRLEGFLKKAFKAIESNDIEVSANIWNELFGGKFTSITNEFIDGSKMYEQITQDKVNLMPIGTLTHNKTNIKVTNTKFFGSHEV